ncbi:hypothetical protein MUGA111182_04855 [Mucilaginibacter galii]|uniref:Bacterial HORMA domain-containing protein n=1 Tax=Mucilaginibacter galii TaxID=2005073 RepID=A0A917N1T3_9SPHI|nr:hypothetical protein [Mucilaginibacter galii]GGI50794.1 hypothetical protein GCM10011425_20060 [Mucilaginibacter galii]
MSQYNTTTNTKTYTVIDIRKTFEGFEADLRMIARRTDKWTMEYAERLIHDVLKLAESKYLKKVSITLLNSSDVVIRAVKYTINEEGKAQSGERPGSNDWNNIVGTRLSMVLEYQTAWGQLTADQQAAYMLVNDFKIGWSASSIDTSFRHLVNQSAQLYGSNGYELKKENYK